MYASLQYGARERICNYCVVDIETTGLSPEQNQIIELSAIRVRDGKIVNRFSELVNPHCELDASITALTGITDEMLMDARCIENVLPEFLAFIGNDVIIGHNVCFDLSFIDRAASEFGTHNFDCKYIDTLQISRCVHPELAHHRLSDMVDHYCINCETAHRALADCESTYNVYERLFEEIAQNPKLVAHKRKVIPSKCDSWNKLDQPKQVWLRALWNAALKCGCKAEDLQYFHGVGFCELRKYERIMRIYIGKKACYAALPDEYTGDAGQYEIQPAPKSYGVQRRVLLNGPDDLNNLHELMMELKEIANIKFEAVRKHFGSVEDSTYYSYLFAFPDPSIMEVEKD